MPGLNDISVNSKNRKKREFHVTQKSSRGYLFIDGMKIAKTKKGFTYLFHVIDGKIEHFWSIDPKELASWELDNHGLYDSPEDWCEGCQDYYGDGEDEIAY